MRCWCLSLCPSWLYQAVANSFDALGKTDLCLRLFHDCRILSFVNNSLCHFLYASLQTTYGFMSKGQTRSEQLGTSSLRFAGWFRRAPNPQRGIRASLGKCWAV